MEKKDENIDKQNQIKRDIGNKMIKMNLEQNKLILKPIPKNDNNKNTKNENNINKTNNASNPFGVVLKKIDKGKNGK